MTDPGFDDIAIGGWAGESVEIEQGNATLGLHVSRNKRIGLLEQRTLRMVDCEARRGKHGGWYDGYVIDVMMDAVTRAQYVTAKPTSAP